MKFLTAVLFVLCTSFGAYAAEGIKTVKVKDNFHVLISPKGGNVTVSTGLDGAFLIDDQLAGRSTIIQAAAKEITKQDIKFVLNTHYHFDHSGGNEFFGKENAVIVAHDNVRKRLSTRQFITYFKKEMLPAENIALPSVTFAQDMTLHYNGDDIRIIHTPNAHTDGDSFAYFTKANIIVAGDLIFNGMYPFIDTEHGGSIKGVIAGLDALLSHADDETVIVPGHGVLMNKIDLQTYRDVLNSITGKVELSIKADKTLTQVIAEKPTQEFDAKMGGGFVPPDAIVKVIYNSLKE